MTVLDTLRAFCFTFLTCHCLLAHGHSWVEEVVKIDQNGSLSQVRGYARANVFRLPGAEVDKAMTYKIPPSPHLFVTDADTICSDRQSKPDPVTALQVEAGDVIILRYQENGHITLPEVNPGKRDSGTVFVYGTWRPSLSEKLRSVHHVWLAPNATDQHGFLIQKTPFDDGRCHQVNNGTISRQRQAAFPHPPTPPEGINVWCGNNITVPTKPRCASTNGPTLDLLSVYWVWGWPGRAGNASSEQYYTTCLDLWVTNRG
nr:hypothetical protein LTR18_009729 [Exophiala xenobiotica]